MEQVPPREQFLIAARPCEEAGPQTHTARAFEASHWALAKALARVKGEPAGDGAHSAEKDLERLRGEAWQRMRDALSGLRNSPRPAGCVQLTNSSWRIRIGDWRAIYDIDDAAPVVTILRIKHRRGVYRDL